MNEKTDFMKNYFTEHNEPISEKKLLFLLEYYDSKVATGKNNLLSQCLIYIKQLNSVIKLLKLDITKLREDLEKKMTENYPEFMQDYKFMQDELSFTYEENDRLSADIQALRKEIFKLKK